MLQETTATCTESFEPQTDCPNGVPQAAIDAAVATYTADLAAANANRAAYYAANNITPPPPPPPAPTLAPGATANYVPVYSGTTLLNPPAVVAAPQTSAAPQATALQPSQIMPASTPTTAPTSTAPTAGMFSTAEAWLQASTWGLPNLVLVAAALGVGFYFFTRRAR